MNALHGLKQNNIHYTDIEINQSWIKGKAQCTMNMLVSTTEAENNDSIVCGDTEQGNENLQCMNKPRMMDSPMTVKIYKTKSDDELYEVQAAADTTAEISGQPYESFLQIENIEQTIFSLAPGRNSNPNIH